MSGKYGELFKNLGKDRFLLLLFAGVMLVIIAMPTGKKEEGREEQKTVTETVSIQENELESYRKNLCVQLKKFLQNVEGAGLVEVYITMHSTGEIIVERNSPYTRSSEEEKGEETSRIRQETETHSEVVLAEQEDGSMAPIVVKELSPSVKGIVVAAQGADNSLVRKEITEALLALFGIEEHKIKVVKLNT